MTSYFTKSQVACLLMLISFFVVGCSGKGSNPTPVTPVTPPVDNTPKVTVTSLSVTTGVYNTEVVITGTNFSTAVTNDQVFFNGKAATVSAATATKLTVKVPLAAGTGAVSVKISNGTEVSGPTFTYQQSWIVSTFAGSGTYGYADGAATDAKFNFPSGLVFDATGNLIVSESGNNDIRKITPDGIVSTIAGSRRAEKNNGKGTDASFYGPSGLAIDKSGNIFVADYYNSLIRKIDPDYNVTTFAGDGNYAYVDGKGVAASFFGPAEIKFDGTGNMYVSDLNNALIRKITPDATVSTFSKAVLNPVVTGKYDPVGLAFDKDYNLFFSLELGGKIQKVTTAGVLSTFTGIGSTAPAVDGPATTATFRRPFGLVFDKDGNMYVTDFTKIRKVTPDGQVSTFAGLDNTGFGNGTVATATFNNITSIAIDKSGNLFVADGGNHQIRKIAFE